jgi:hypothetical protein
VPRGSGRAEGRQLLLQVGRYGGGRGRSRQWVAGDWQSPGHLRQVRSLAGKCGSALGRWLARHAAQEGGWTRSRRRGSEFS